MIASWVVFSLFTLATAFATNVSEVIAFRFLAGIGLGGAIPSAIALTSEYSPKRFRATAVMLIYCCYSLGFVASGFVAGALLSRYHWGSVFLVGGVTPLALTYLLCTAQRANRHSRKTSAPSLPHPAQYSRRALRQLDDRM
jgi:AAHS family 4-hydroxybenzoate transporter-like MFS transporter